MGDTSQNLQFFNSQGDYLNFLYNQNTQRYEGKLFFDENSDDTFKTVGLYVFEKIPAFSYQNASTNTDHLYTKKFQLFNQFGINFTSNNNDRGIAQTVLKIEATNKNPSDFGKWIYGSNFEAIYNTGDEVIFNNSVFEFNNAQISYTVVDKKKGAILIISSLNNKQFSQLYGTAILPVTTISSLNTVKIYNYINKSNLGLITTLSNWNEPVFYQDLYSGQKISVINSPNAGIYTVNNIVLDDKVYHNFLFDATLLINSDYIKTEISFANNNQIVYDKSLIFGTNSTVTFETLPSVIRNGVKFFVNNSISNSGTLTVKKIKDFKFLTVYNINDIVFYHNNIYKCIFSYSTDLHSITPLNLTYWTISNFIYTEETLVSETLLNSEVYLVNNKVTLTNTYTGNTDILAASTVDVFAQTFKGFDVTLTYNQDIKTIEAKSDFPSEYVEIDYFYKAEDDFTNKNYQQTTATATNISLSNVPFTFITLNLLKGTFSYTFNYSENKSGDFYFTTGSHSTVPLTIDLIGTSSVLWWNYQSTHQHIGTTNSIIVSYETEYVEKIIVYEKIIGIDENLTNERNSDFSQKNEEFLLITSLDRSGIAVYINNQRYFVNTEFIYNPTDTAEVDLEKTLDKTIRSFVSKYFTILGSLGIIVEGYSYISESLDTLHFITTFSNINLNINKVIIGSVAEYFFIKKELTMYDISIINNNNSEINIGVNNQNYQIAFTSSITNTLENWVSIYENKLQQLDIYPKNINSQIIFYTKKQSTSTELNIYLGKNYLSGEIPYTIKKFSVGNLGLIITSNTIRIDELNSTDSFEKHPFATGEILSLQNSKFFLNNKEYNIIYLDTTKIGLSYNGAFFGSTTQSTVSGFDELAFNNGFGYDPAGNNIVSTASTPFTFTSINNPDTNIYSNDFTFINNLLFLFSSNNTNTTIEIFNQIYFKIDKITITGKFIKFVYNHYTKLLYILTSGGIYIYDPITFKETEHLSITNITYFDIDSYQDKIYLSLNDTVNSYIRTYNADYTYTTILLSATSNTDPVRVLYNKNTDETYAFICGTTASISKIYRIDSVSNVVGNVNSIIFDSVMFDQIHNKFYFFSNILHVMKDDIITDKSNFVRTSFSDMLFNPFNYKTYLILNTDILYELDENVNILKQTAVGRHGKLLYNQIDGNIYMGSTSDDNLSIYSPVSGTIILTVLYPAGFDKILYDYNNQNFFTLNLSNKKLYYTTIDFTLGVGYRDFSEIYITAETFRQSTGQTTNIQNGKLNIQDNRYGTLSDNYINNYATNNNINFLLLKVKEYLRFPRENFKTDTQVSYRFDWLNNLDETIFLYNHLNQILEKKQNIEYVLDYIDSETDITSAPEPMQAFVGYNASDEGVNNRVLILSKLENTVFDINTDLSMNVVTFIDFEVYGEIVLADSSILDFFSSNIKVGQIIQIEITDNVNTKFNKYYSPNNFKKFIVQEVAFKKLVVTYIDENLVNETTDQNDKFMETKISVIEKIIGYFNIFGQTEIEDVRYNIELLNTGKLIAPNDSYIFKQYDINEGGVDWKFLNKKRKELIHVRNDIYNYVGSYKAIINAINYFGYNDLELNEYFQNINKKSGYFGKLLKIKIPNIFDNTVSGWTEEAFFSNLFPNDNYMGTDKFNLTYKITDADGNNLLSYTVDEVFIKLFGLKKWLEKNVIPITHKITDITGEATVINNFGLFHENHEILKLNISDTITPVQAKVNEVYKMPVNSGSNVFNVVIDLYTQDSLPATDPYLIDIRTYKTYDLWQTFTNYTSGDKIRYFGNVYEAEIVNKNQNPLKYNTYNSWKTNTAYRDGDIILFNNEVFAYQFLTPKNSYGYSLFLSDLHEKYLEIDIPYMGTVSNMFSGIDILNSVNNVVGTATGFTYTGTWSVSSNVILPSTHNAGGGDFIYKLGYTINTSVDNNSTLGIGSATYSYNLTVSNNTAAPNNYISSGNIISTNTIDFMHSISAFTFSVKNYVLEIATFSIPEGIDLNLYFESRDNVYTLLDEINIAGAYHKYYVLPFQQKRRPKFKIITKTNINYTQNFFNILNSDLNRSFTFNYRFLDSVPVNIAINSDSDLLFKDTALQHTVADLYLAYSATHSLFGVTPSNISVAFGNVIKMIKLFNQTKIAYKIQYSNYNPVKNIELTDTNPEFVLWNNITVWKKIELEPVQKITEYRGDGNLLPYNFTVDSKIDPYVVISVYSDNGYGQTYKHLTAYEVKYEKQ